ncbi:elongin A, like isoform X2 [Erpetoichthys calabaricus]|uniref:elongin A, like isoform X2 n=1 Tax=Erpetoichthys calabaricus TaxID=27687 RepID=UPI0010A09FFB|nr:elongin A, like isoform X2 [Erpetoichthys calabaricus]
MANKEIVEKVLKFKQRLKETSDSQKVMKILKRLKELKITLRILADTGIGKAVNGFRKHEVVGDLAKALVNHWKQMVPKNDNCVDVKDENTKKPCKKEQLVPQDGNSRACGGPHNKDIALAETKMTETKRSLKSTKENEGLKKVQSKKKLADHKLQDHDSRRAEQLQQGNTKEDHVHGHVNQKSISIQEKEDTRSCDHENYEKGNKSKHKVKSKVPPYCSKVNANSVSSRESETKQITEVCPGSSKPNNRLGKQAAFDLKNQKNTKAEKIKDSLSERTVVKKSHDEFEVPTMSFESYLTYDQNSVPQKRRKRTSVTKKCERMHKSCVNKSCPTGTEDGEKQTLPEKELCERSPKKIKPGSLMDLLNIPLPTFLPDCSVTSPPHLEKLPEAAPRIAEVPPVFTGQRLNSKMQVYSGAKTTFLSSMMTLYQQCIRVLQNNIDSLSETGGVPFEILEPVLDRCTPQQLYRIEEYNPVYIGETDDLWMKHCQKEFKNFQLDEYESWREMYLRLLAEREQKFKFLTKTIASAHSGKPQGRKVKLAFVNSIAKPPREVRRQQEIRGTAGSSENKGKCNSYESQKFSKDHVSPPNTRASQDPKKFVRKIAPMMAKSLRAFRSRVGRR